MAYGTPKTGRRASESERDRAREWASLYRQAQAEPGGRLCLNPDDEPEIQEWFDGNDPEFLLSLLDGFAQTGTFTPVDGAKAASSISINHALKQARADGASYEAAIEAMANKYGRSESVIARTVSASIKRAKGKATVKP